MIRAMRMLNAVEMGTTSGTAISAKATEPDQPEKCLVVATNNA